MEDNGYNKSFMIIFNNDEKNREVILSFINSIPVFLRNKLSFIFSFPLGSELLSELYIEKRFDGNKYFISIDSNKELSVGMHSSNNLEENDIFVLTIRPYTNGIEKSYSLGSFLYQSKDIDNPCLWNCDNVRYDIVRKKDKIFLLKTNIYNILFQKKVKEIDFDNINGNLNDLILVRKRGRRFNGKR